MDQSTTSLSMYTNGADVMEQAGLAHLNPSPLHCAAIQGRECVFEKIIWQTCL